MFVKRCVPTALAVLLVLTVGISVGTSQPAVNIADEKSDLRLEIRTDGSSYRAGDHVNVRAELKNIRDVQVPVFVERPSELFFRFIVVRVDNSGLSVPMGLTPTGKERTDPMRAFGNWGWTLSPGKSVGETLDIGPWYPWEPGTYKLACYVDMPTSIKTDSAKLRYSSNELTLTIIP